jgi:hypothetical protein
MKDESISFEFLSSALGKCFYFQAWISSVFGAMFELVKWEYKVVPIKTQIHSDHYHAERAPVMENVQNDLNALGNEGWELVSIQDVHLLDDRIFTVAYFKRQRNTDKSAARAKQVR